MKILINTPHLEHLGGVANHYKGLRNYWKEDVIYNFIGGRNGISGILIIPFDIFKFLVKCLIFYPDIIILNPSLGKNAIPRDFLFLKLATLFGFKTIVFFHGWNKNQEQKINSNFKKFASKLDRAHTIIVLAEEFRRTLLNWGIKSPIYLTSTKIDDQLLSKFDFSEKSQNYNILFLSRIEKEKGIFIAIDAYEKIQKKYPNSSLTIAGDGSALVSAKKIVIDRKIKNTNFLGKISGKNLKNAFRNANLYLFPTYGEGMPTSVLEAMAFGLPVISRPVGGLNDFFENDKMGYLIDSFNSDDFTERISFLFEHEEKMMDIGKYNHYYAIEKFLASKVAKQLENICKETWKRTK
ncbi:glycosyltransferase family 4 protein [uncultured Draconibacterium sp.]|uniref:glycosyltransferase family 4 protein n=1 Tax=uncultured Draconibacterium sp. TaxID=1573823 RepID=UPI003216C2DE